VTKAIDPPGTLIEPLRNEVHGAAWFAALGEPLTESDRRDADCYATALGLGTLTVSGAHNWSQAEFVMKSPDWSKRWWDLEEVHRRTVFARAGVLYAERPLQVALTELTTEAGNLVHGKAAAAAARMGGAAPASIHVAAGAAAQAVYQVALARLAKDGNSPFESKFRLFAAGRWPLGVVGSRLILF
jgi:hypothetical protein